MTRPVMCLALVLLVGPLAGPASAECVGLGPKNYYWAIFEGTVTDIRDVGSSRGELAIDVHWAWKGNVRQKETAYFTPSIEGPHLRVGDRRVFFMLPDEASIIWRPGVPAVPENKPGFLVPCGGAQLPEGRIVNPLGRPWRP